MDGNAIPERQGYVYFVRAGKTKFVKIGWTRDLRMRLSVLQTGNQAKLKVLRVLSGDRETEGSIQRWFASFRHRGEWFWLDESIAKFIADSEQDCVADEAMAKPDKPYLSDEEITGILDRLNAQVPA